MNSIYISECTEPQASFELHIKRK